MASFVCGIVDIFNDLDFCVLISLTRTPEQAPSLMGCACKHPPFWLL